MYPDEVTVDRTLPDEPAVREYLAGIDLTAFDGDETVERLHRLLYPVFRVEFTYDVDGAERNRDESAGVGSAGVGSAGVESAEGGSAGGGSTRRYAALVDGLWAGNDEALSRYRRESSSTATLPLGDADLGAGDAGLGRTVLLEFQASDDRAGSHLPQQFADVRAARGTESPRMDPAAFLDRMREIYGLPEGLGPETFGAVESVSRLHLPFWLAEFRSERRDSPLLVTLRDLEDLPETSPHQWLADWIGDDPARLATYGYDVARRRGRRTTESGCRGAADRTTAAQPAEIVQPDGVDLDAESLVETTVDRGFGDVGGMRTLKRRLEKTVLAPIEEAVRYERYGIDPVSGVLLYGPPGCGKTYVAVALAGELGHPFIEVTSSDLTSKYMGEPAQRVADLFAIARANQPCVVFIDELDAVAGARDGDMQTSERQLVTQLLTELEDAAESDVVVIGATNRLEDVDGAIRRSGRFDERVEVPPPDAEARREIVRIHLAGRPTVDDLDLEEVVEETAGYAASDLERLADEAARTALTAGDPIAEAHLREAVAGTDSSIEGWIGEFRTDDGRTVTQPDDVDLTARTLVEPAPARDFDDVGGMSPLLDRLRRRVIDPLENPERFEQYDLDVLTGLLLYGPPGCGKTYVTEALAGELGRGFIEVTPADLTSKWMGEPAQRVADLFEIARANQPCICFIDELDAIAGARGDEMNTSERQVVNQLLTELEDVEDEDVVVVGATNLVADVDPAIRRSGRFDERIEVPPPDAAARRAVLEVHLAERPVAEDLSLDPVVEGTAGYASSDLALLAENAARRAVREGTPVGDEHLAAALEETPSSLAAWSDRDRYAAEAKTADLRYIG